VVSRVVQGSLGRHYILGVKAGWQGLQVNQSPDQQSGARQQDDREHYFTGNQSLANPTVAAARSASGSRCRE
jgi:hypothetical protein